ncbi:MAG: alpha/beta hydrolase, partial [Verrucomicrobiales bacterium]|nr:alpha/beta hydrolase [Verrucomicrobiales bacterium]
MRLLLAVLLITTATAAPEPSEIIPLWPAKPPGRHKQIGPERDQSTPDSQLIAGKSVIRLTDVSTPEIHAYPAPANTANGTSVLIYPGGGFYVLAWDLEGTEVAA